ncbi:hypothetical protein PRNP1_003441 [Phytophthora ramorum]
MQAVKVSRDQFFKLIKQKKRTTFPVLKFRSVNGSPNSIYLHTHNTYLKLVAEGEEHYVVFHPRFFRAALGKGIRISHAVQSPGHMAVSPGSVETGTTSHSPRTWSSRRAAPRRKFGTVMSTDGTTFCATDQGCSKRRFDAIDALKSRLSKLDNEAKAEVRKRHPAKIHTTQNLATNKATMEASIKIAKSVKQRERARLRREIRAINTKITNATTDFHQKFTSVLAVKFKTLLLPSFQTSEMIRSSLKSRNDVVTFSVLDDDLHNDLAPSSRNSICRCSRCGSDGEEVENRVRS